MSFICYLATRMKIGPVRVSLSDLYLSRHHADVIKALEVAIKADHGYNQDSRAVQNLIEVMSSYNKEQRRQFLQL